MGLRTNTETKLASNLIQDNGHLDTCPLESHGGCGEQ